MARINAVAASQFGVVSTRDLRSISVDSAYVYRKVRSGEMVPLLPGTWACGPAAARAGYQQICMSAVLYAGTSSAISHVTAAVRLGVWKRSKRSEIHVSTTRDRRSFGSLPVHLHRTLHLDPDEIVDVDGMPTTSMTRTACDLGTQLTAHQITCVLDEASFLRILDVTAILRRLNRFRGSRGNSIVRRAIELHLGGSAGTRSWSEDIYLEAILASALPEPVVNTRGTIPGFDHEPDFVWHEQRLVIEIDGPGHTKPRRLCLDAAADARLRSAGWRVVRFKASDVRRDPARFVRTTHRLLEGS
jgi:hypothetical protein